MSLHISVLEQRCTRCLPLFGTLSAAYLRKNIGAGSAEHLHVGTLGHILVPQMRKSPTHVLAGESVLHEKTQGRLSRGKHVQIRDIFGFRCANRLGRFVQEKATFPKKR
jgi:hypothetical protein